MPQIQIDPPTSFFEDAPEHRRQIADYAKAAGTRANDCIPKDGSERMTGPLKLPRYTQATPSDTRPTAEAEAGDVIYATDVSKAQVWTGAAWENLN